MHLVIAARSTSDFVTKTCALQKQKTCLIDCKEFSIQIDEITKEKNTIKKKRVVKEKVRDQLSWSSSDLLQSGERSSQSINNDQINF